MLDDPVRPRAAHLSADAARGAVARFRPRRHADASAAEHRRHRRRTHNQRMFRAQRRKIGSANRRDSLILHKFEALLSWANLMNLNRHVDDDDQDDAKKAAEDQEELGLGQISKAPATRLRLHLDLAPEDADLEASPASTLSRMGRAARAICRPCARAGKPCPEGDPGCGCRLIRDPGRNADPRRPPPVRGPAPRPHHHHRPPRRR